MQLGKQRRRGFGAPGLLYRLATLPGERHAATRRVRHNSPAPGDISIHPGLQGLGQYPPGTLPQDLIYQRRRARRIPFVPAVITDYGKHRAVPSRPPRQRRPCLRTSTRSPGRYTPAPADPQTSDLANFQAAMASGCGKEVPVRPARQGGRWTADRAVRGRPVMQRLGSGARPRSAHRTELQVQAQPEAATFAVGVLIAAALLVAFSSVLDGSDGEVARLTLSVVPVRRVPRRRGGAR